MRTPTGSVTAGRDTTVEGVVTSRFGPPSGQVELRVDGATVGTATVDPTGAYSLSWANPPAGSHAVEVLFTGDRSRDPSGGWGNSAASVPIEAVRADTGGTGGGTGDDPASAGGTGGDPASAGTAGGGTGGLATTGADAGAAVALSGLLLGLGLMLLAIRRRRGA